MLTQLASGAGWTGLAAYMPTTSSLFSVSFRDMNTANNAFITSNAAAVPGTSASPALPDEVAVVVTMRTAKTGQANRGRVYNPAWATNALGAGGIVLAAAVTALGTWATNNLLAAFAPRGLTAVLGQPARASYTGTTGTLHPARTAGSIAITSAVVRDNHWDTIRRRGLK
jgi:hypothetical protein